MGKGRARKKYNNTEKHWITAMKAKKMTEKMGDLEQGSAGRPGTCGNTWQPEPSRMRSTQRGPTAAYLGPEGLDDDSLLQGMWTGPDAINGRLGSLTNP